MFTGKRKDRDRRENVIQKSRCLVVRVYGNGKEWTDGRDVDKEALKGSFQGLFCCLEGRRGRSQSSLEILFSVKERMGFPGGSVVKNLPAMQETQETWI